MRQGELPGCRVAPVHCPNPDSECQIVRKFACFQFEIFNGYLTEKDIF
jgi:hypothetical protein